MDEVKVQLDQAHLRSMYRRLCKARREIDECMSELRLVSNACGVKVDWEEDYVKLEFGTQPPEEDFSTPEGSEVEEK